MNFISAPSIPVAKEFILSQFCLLNFSCCTFHSVTASPSGHYTITKGKPVPLPEPRPKPPYPLDGNCEWVLDAKSRKVCWISPEDIRRGNGGHFWAGLSLIMVGDSGVVKKLTFKEPDC